MAVVRMVQVTIDKIIHVVPMWNRRMSTVRSVYMVRSVALAVVRSAPVGVGVGNCDDVLVIVAVMRAVQMTVVQVAYVIVVLDCDVSAARAVRMFVVFVNFVIQG